jgi:hypothetical protein
LWLAVGAYLEINRIRGLGACDDAIKACKAFNKLLEKKKGKQTTAKNAGQIAGNN